jgi:predicted glycosyltransferase
MGHLVRSLALAARLAEHFRVVFLNGGPLPKRMRVPEGVEIIDLPPLGLAPDGQLVSRDRRRDVARAQSLRQRIILEAYHNVRPQGVFVELFPFGRKKFAYELLPLLAAAKATSPRRPFVCCSLRDILVGKKTHQQKHDERAVEIANTYFDTVLIHSDPAFARLEESLLSSAALRIPVHYTGFVQPDRTPCGNQVSNRKMQILISAGGGIVGEKLFRTAIEAYPLLRQYDDVKLKIVTGPFLPEEAWQSLRVASQGQPRLSLKRFVPDLCAEMRNAVVSISQCGYNTALDILRAGVPALVVPFADGAEDEQLKRARKLEGLGAIRVLEQDELDAARLASEIQKLLGFTPQKLPLDLNGACNTARLVRSLALPLQRKSKAPGQIAKGTREVHT